MIGRTVGEYRILEQRGEGGMGMFYKAQDLRLDRIVGLKTLRPELLDDPELLNRLQIEAKSLARLDHPNIARLLHYLVVENQHFIVMEYVDGLNLSEKSQRDGLLPPALLTSVIRQICAAIGYAHGKNIIHRDIKPSNILITPDNTIKVTDFGIAKILGDSARTKTGAAAGSLPYMSPEQIRGSGVDARTDIYQLGVTLFELTTGRRPFTGETEYELMTQHLEAPPPRPSSLNAQVTPAMDDVILKALAKSPDDRYQSAADLDGALKEAGEAQPEAATVFRRTTAQTAPPASKRKGRGKAVVTVVAAVVVIGGILGVVMSRKEKRPVTGPPPSPPPVSAVISAHIPWDSLPMTAGPLHVAARAPDANVSSFEATFLPRSGNEWNSTATFPSPATFIFTAEARDSISSQIVARAETTAYLSERPDNRVVLIVRPVRDFAVHMKADTVRGTPESKPPTSKPRPASGTETNVERGGANLTIDIQPFSMRSEVSQVWLDGRKLAGRMPLETHTEPAVHTIRWQFGGDRFSDTVAVGTGGRVEKALFIESGHGRLNVAAVFDDGGYGDIRIDGEATGQGTPYEFKSMAAGPHEVVVTREGYRMQEGPQIVRVTADQRASIVVDMVPKKAGQ